MKLKKLENHIGLTVSAIRKNYTDRGPKNMVVTVKGKNINICFEVDSVQSELFLVDTIIQLGGHQILLDRMGEQLIDLFTPFIQALNPVLSIESLIYHFPETSMRQQTIHVTVNENLESLCRSKKLSIPNY
ncbi:hypothetical protein [Paenibacillus sp. DCT19]|uniref:hypothetical protein n=1 Tax=Paenibacillus sp. DCT19 TaxID=2211212 RepID=UPI000FE222B3|nr:hypothetical protein [Paenibacillus sp. DCT19]